MNQAGKIFKVQIKGTKDIQFDRANGGMGRYMITTSTGSCKKETIDCTKVDILAAYIESIPTWYLIPCLEINQCIRISLYAHNPKSKAKHEKFREAWDIFKAA
jgi:hypothetical protein